MAMPKRPKALKVKKSVDPERARRRRMLVAHLLLAALLLGGAGAGYFYADRYVEQRVAFTAQPLLVVVKNRPPWMNDFLVEQIALIARPIGGHSAFDHKMLVDIADTLGRNPWVRKVHSVRRAYTRAPGDTLELDCEYRAPVALVKYGAFYWLVDETGVRLSDRFTEADLHNIQFSPDGHTVIRVIEGVHYAVPHFAGERWSGEDLAAGLKMLNYLFDKPYAEEILRVNVANVGGRVDAKEPQIVLLTKYGTQIWWGRPPNDNDVDAFIEVPTARKLNYLRYTFEQFGRVDANEKWLDLRFDKVGSPSPPPPPQQQQPTSASGRRRAAASTPPQR